MKIAFQMDHIDSINPATDSTFLLALEAMKRGYELFYFTVYDLYLSGNKLKAKITPIKFYDALDNYYELGNSYIEELQNLDIIFIRQDPPFDMRYITNTYLLSKIQDKVTIINNPDAIRNFSEKLYPHEFSEYMPETIISENLDILQNSYQEMGDIVIKPLYACGGQDISLIKENDEKFLNKITALIKKYQTPIIIQKFLPEVSSGDTRVLIACGKIVGQILRTPAANQITSNLCAGGTASYTELSPMQRELAEKIAADSFANKLYFVGLDFIGNYLTEINVTSPTGIKQASINLNKDIAKEMWDLFLKL